MRFLKLTAILLCVLASPAFAQAPKQVEVINDPLAVEVVNPTLPSPSAHFQLVGFTSTTYTGNMGGFFGVTQKCQLEFANSRMCTNIEVEQTTSIPSGLAGNAWVNEGINSGGLAGANCRNWLVEESSAGTSVNAQGTPAGNVQCTVPIPIACCALVP